MELRMELVTETQASLRHTAGVPGRGQGQEAKLRAGRRLYRWPGVPHPAPALTKQTWSWMVIDFYRELTSIYLISWLVKQDFCLAA